jgi:hypothetical protein
VRRVKGDYEKFKSKVTDLRGQAESLASALDGHGLTPVAGRVRVVAKRLEGICGMCRSLGSTVPGLDDATLKKVTAEWKVCRRQAAGVTGTGPTGPQFQRMLEAMTECEAYLNYLLG